MAVAGTSGDVLLTRQARREAMIVYWLVRFWPRWVNRRVESFAMVDEATIERRMSIDFELPERVLGSATRDYLHHLPLSTLRKRVLRNFDMRDEESRSLPMLGTSQNGRIAGNALVAIAEVVLEGAPSPLAQVALRQIALRPVAEAEQIRLLTYRAAVAHPNNRRTVMDELATASGAPLEVRRSMELPSERSRIAEDLRGITRNRETAELMDELVNRFILLTPMPREAPARRVVKVKYEMPLPEHAHDTGQREETATSWFFSRLGWKPTSINLTVTAARQTGSYHAEFAAPADAEIVNAQLLEEPDERPRVAEQAARLEGTPSPAPQRGEGATTRPGRTAGAYEVGPLERTHLTRAAAKSERKALFVVRVRADRAVLPRPALVTAMITAGLLAAGRSKIDVLATEVEAAAALLLLVPAILSAYIVRPGEHPVVSDLLVGMRLLVLASGLCAVGAAASLLLGFSQDDLRAVWTYLLGVALVSLGGVLVANFVPLARPPKPNSVR